MRTIGVVTTTRADYGIYRPILQAIHQDPALQLQMYVSGMHLSPEFGRTIEVIEAEGYPIVERIEMLLSSDSPEGVAKSMGLGTLGFGQALSRHRPDLLLVLGDRFEMLAAVVATLPFKIPVAHIHGGEATEGLIDESIRHSITKMSHLHFATTEPYARRIEQLGEEPWRVSVSGAPSLDNLRGFEPLSREVMTERFGLVGLDSPLLVTFHPVTLEYDQTENHIAQLLEALEQADRPVVFTYPNADTQGRLIIDRIEAFCRGNAKAQAVVNLGTEGYFSLMTYAGAMVGNSSSGILEAASFGLPVINIGNRQRGRVHGENVLDVACHAEEILAGISKVLSPEFKRAIDGMSNPYAHGDAASHIVARLKSVKLDDKLLLKRFYDLPSELA